MPTIDVILLSYRRPANIGPIVDVCLKVPQIDRIHLIDQGGPDHPVEATFNDPRVLASRAPNIGPGRRLSHASELSCDLVLAIDDDLFLTAAQISALIARSLQEPTRVHGIWGQLLFETPEGIRLKSGIMYTNRPVDVLNRVYAFTPEHARNALRIAQSLGLERHAMGPVDDVLLSFGGRDRPRCHDLGTLRECRTSNHPDIALWRQSGFESLRVDVIQRIRELGLSWSRA